MKYLAYGELDGIPNVIVDGSAQADTVLTLSHWPNSPTPVDLRDDLSAQIAFHYLDHPEHHVAAEVVSNNHFDQDGFMSVYALVDPDGAHARRARVSSTSRAPATSEPSRTATASGSRGRSPSSKRSSPAAIRTRRCSTARLISSTGRTATASIGPTRTRTWR